MTPTVNRYVLVTAAYNEDRYIERLLQAVIAQTVPPLRWIVVSDGSTDRTDEIVQRYAADAPFIRLHRITEDHPRNFRAQVHAINGGLSMLHNLEYDFVGNIDADITLDPTYFERLLQKFALDPGLGLAGGTICEKDPAGRFRPRRIHTESSVAHACQLFRTSVFRELGGTYRSLPYGGPDTYAEVSVRRLGWGVASFTDLPVYHHRPTNAAEGALNGWFRQGKMDYSLGALPIFEMLKLLRRLRVRPYVMGSLYRLAGFVQSYWRREERAVSPEFMQYLRSEQKRRVLAMFGFRNSNELEATKQTPPAP